jgi:hypothetical protein
MDFLTQFLLAMSYRRKFKALFNSKAGKLLPVLLIALLVGSASSTVYVYYIANTTATPQTAKVVLRPGGDLSSSCSTYPCASYTAPSTSDYEAVTLSFFPSATSAVQPATYYTNFTTIQNHEATASHTLNKVEIYNIGGATAANLGKITVYYCTIQTDFNPDGSLVTPGNCPGSYSIVAGSSGTQVLVSGASLAAGAKGYIEVAAYAATPIGGSVTFDIAFQWI